MTGTRQQSYLSDKSIERTNRIIDAVMRYPTRAGTQNLSECLFIKELPEL